MTVDLLDAAFLRRLAARARQMPPTRAEQPRAATVAAAPASPAGSDRVVAVERTQPAPTRPRPPVATEAVVPRPVPPVPVADLRPSPPPQPATAVVAGDTGIRPATDDVTPAMAASHREHPDPMVERLLALAPDEWAALARDVEAARQRGRRVIAVAGSRGGEGRTTLVRCLAATLRAHGRDVALAEPCDLAMVATGSDGRGPTHDKRIVLVDAGIWFPPGPIRRARLQVASLGCEAAILVRRAGSSGTLARQAALEALGIEVLGEVLTFASPSAGDCIPGKGTAA